MNMHLGRRERKRQQTADLLAETAFELFEANGYEEVTMEQIAAAADVAKGTLYNHFPVKEALLRHYMHRQLVKQSPAIQAKLLRTSDTIERMVLLLRYAAAWGERHRRYLPHYLRYRLGQQPDDAGQHEHSGMGEVFTRLLTDAQEAGRLRRDRDIATLIHYFRHLYLAAMMRWLETPNGKLADEFMVMLDLFLNGAAENLR